MTARQLFATIWRGIVAALKWAWRKVRYLDDVQGKAIRDAGKIIEANPNIVLASVHAAAQDQVKAYHFALNYLHKIADETIRTRGDASTALTEIRDAAHRALGG